MRALWFWIYNIICIPFLWIFFRLLYPFNSKVREGFKGRRDLFDKLGKSLSSLRAGKKNTGRVIIHSSSLGEYQQAIPLIDKLLEKNYNVILTFFSPSGFKNSKYVPEGAVKSYIPFDSYFKMKKFLRQIDPAVMIFMRYDLWFNMLYLARKKNILTVLANSRFDENDRTWNIPVASSFKRTLYRMIDRMFVIDDHDEKNYKEKLQDEKIQIMKVGDSKFERVYRSIFSNDYGKSILPGSIIKNKKIFIMGSSWKDDEEILLPAIDKALEFESDLLVVHVPHEPKETKIRAIEKRLDDYKRISHIRYSQIAGYSNENFIIVDSMGLLAQLYSLAYTSYVGGGFKTGLHNILEPAIFNMPVFFSNKVKNSDEDEVMINAGCGIIVSDTKQFYKEFRQILSDKKLRDEIGNNCKFVFKDSLGVTEKIINNITNNVQ
jgi:3-deoxy-D-manno-octulosonic-acid transferase